MQTDKRKHEILAGIDVGSSSIRMKIAEVDGKGNIKTLDTLRKSVTLGKDAFNTGMIKLEHVEDTCRILKGFKRLMNEYKVDRYKIAATSAIREADNCDYILEHIHVKTGFKVEIISDAEERFFTYKAIIDRLKEFPILKQEGVLIVDIGAGGVEITLYSEGTLAFTQYIKTGALRLREILSDLERKTLSFSKLMEEFIESEIDRFTPVLEEHTFKHFLGLGAEVGLMHEIAGGSRKNNEATFIDKQTFYRLHHEITGKSQQQLAEQYGLKPEQAETLIPAVMVFEKFLSLTASDKIYTPMVSLRDGLIRDMVDKKYHIQNEALSRKDIIASVKKLGTRYLYDEKHASQVERFAMELFDQTKKLHGYADKERFLLQVAAILHDIGKYINLKNHNTLSYNIIIHSDILGLSKKDMEVVANVARYHGLSVPSMYHPNYAVLDYDSRILVSKLAALLKIADSLDKSHKQKISGIKVILNEKGLTIKVDAFHDILLEEWEFGNKSNLFTEVYGIKANFINKRM